MHRKRCQRLQVLRSGDSAIAGARTTPLKHGVLAWTLATLASSSAVWGQIENSLADCARIVASTDRLACYDALSAARKSATRDWNRGFGAGAARTAPVMAEPLQLEPQTPAEFGFDSRRSNGAPDEIQTRYDGEFSGWSGNTLFRLENGQVWKQAQSGRSSYRATHPVVTIKRTALGGYRLLVEGSDQSVRVERVK
jgi:hypothetical protein